MARLAVLGRRVRLSPVRSHPKGQKGTQLEVSYSLFFKGEESQEVRSLHQTIQKGFPKPAKDAQEY